MNPGIKLNQEEEKLFIELKKINAKIEEKAKLCDSFQDKAVKAYKSLWKKGAEVAYHLYKCLTSRGIEFQFHHYLLRNRYECEKCWPENYRFYVHPDSIKQLIKCIEAQPTEWWRD